MQMKLTLTLFATVAVIVSLLLLHSRAGFKREEAHENVPTGERVATTVIEERPKARKDLVDSNVAIEKPSPLLADGSSISQTQPDAKNVDVARSMHGSFDPITVSEAMTNSVDTSVAGRRLTLSPATMPKCAEEKDDDTDCEDKHRIEQFTGEPRDSAWASPAEDTLRSMAEVRNTGFLIRNLECRLTTCILEVESTSEILAPDVALKANDFRQIRVIPFRARAGDEYGPQGRKVTVTLWIYQRIR